MITVRNSSKLMLQGMIEGQTPNYVVLFGGSIAPYFSVSIIKRLFSWSKQAMAYSTDSHSIFAFSCFGRRFCPIMDGCLRGEWAAVGPLLPLPS
jgi:hypothetical protein